MKSAPPAPSRPTAEIRREASRLTTVIDPIRPAVVVRRRVYDMTTLERESVPRSCPDQAPPPQLDDEDERAPPSSIDVARALASLRTDELQRAEDLVNADERWLELRDDRATGFDRPEDAREGKAREPRASVVESAPRGGAATPRPKLRIGRTLTLARLAAQMGMEVEDLTGMLVARGFYSLHAKTIMGRETARTIAELLGLHVEDAPEPVDPEARSPRSRGRMSKKRGSASKRRRSSGSRA